MMSYVRARATEGKPDEFLDLCPRIDHQLVELLVGHQPNAKRSRYDHWKDGVDDEEEGKCDAEGTRIKTKMHYMP